MVNTVTLIGYIGATWEDGKTASGKVYATNSIATSKSYKNQQGEWENNTTWHNVVAWGQLAERLVKSVMKGDLVYITGEISYSSRDVDGRKQYYTNIIIQSYRMLKSKQNNRFNPDDTDAPDSIVSTPSESIPF